MTGDLGTRDADGFIRFVGRGDDVITSAGYRIGPASIEDSLLRHPAVSMAAVIGAPDRERTEIVMAFVVLNPGFVGDEALVREIQQHVKTRLAAHEYPREIRFVDSLPLTATGKVIRKALREDSRKMATMPRQNHEHGSMPTPSFACAESHAVETDTGAGSREQSRVLHCNLTRRHAHHCSRRLARPAKALQSTRLQHRASPWRDLAVHYHSRVRPPKLDSNRRGHRWPNSSTR